MKINGTLNVTDDIQLNGTSIVGGGTKLYRHEFTSNTGTAIVISNSQNAIDITDDDSFANGFIALVKGAVGFFVLPTSYSSSAIGQIITVYKNSTSNLVTVDWIGKNPSSTSSTIGTMSLNRVVVNETITEL